ncbi:MAG: MBOAT family O-acyltransferase [Eubacteriales bacterium]|nr:MBOAT family O-acyltransferase [Eubacteriales bacterium]
MNFISLEFLCFFPIVLLGYWILPGRFRWILLLAASFFFYMSTNPGTGILLLLTIAVTYYAAREIEMGIAPKRWLVISVAFCLGLLAVFKYAGFLVETVLGAVSFFGGRTFDVTLDVILPAGISFYTFQSLSYVLDVYRGKASCEKHFGYYALFVSFFPQLVAGPVERMGNLLPQLKRTQKFSRENMVDGFWLMLRGFFKKVAAADYFALFADRVYGAPGGAGGLAVVLGTVFFALQIYCDFSGYTDIARGAAKMLGIHLMENFRHPYRAENIQDFWRRWHISLTGWFTDYVYIPLGGSRCGTFRQCRNILLVFALSGLWHGAAWHYVVWGVWHGIFLAGYVLYQRYRPERHTGGRKTGGHMAALALVCFAWVFFRAQSLEDAWILLKQLVCNPTGGGLKAACSFLALSKTAVLRLSLLLASLAVLERFPEKVYEKIRDTRTLILAAVICICMMTAVEFSWLSQLAAGAENTFIYFRF